MNEAELEDPTALRLQYLYARLFQVNDTLENKAEFIRELGAVVVTPRELDRMRKQLREMKLLLETELQSRGIGDGAEPRP